MIYINLFYLRLTCVYQLVNIHEFKRLVYIYITEVRHKGGNSVASIYLAGCEKTHTHLVGDQFHKVHFYSNTHLAVHTSPNTVKIKTTKKSKYNIKVKNCHKPLKK